MFTINKIKFIALSALSFGLVITSSAFADSSAATMAEGINGVVDKNHHDPIVGYSTEVSSDGSSAKILVDASVANPDDQDYPLTFQFFVNGRQFSMQYFSKELPGPIGIDVPKEMAPLPFTYAIIATQHQPNRQYETVIQGTLYANSISPKTNVTCTLDIPDSSSTISFTSDANSVALAQSSDTAATLTFTATNSASNRQLSVSVPLTLAATSSSGSQSATGVLTTDESGASANYNVSGTITIASSKVTNVDLKDTAATGKTTLNCS